jgi:hypothetical protein
MENGNERWGGYQAGDFELFEATGNAEAARASFVSNILLRARMRFANTAQSFLYGV